jgi:predicted SpoU family rRNA methylase
MFCSLTVAGTSGTLAPAGDARTSVCVQLRSRQLGDNDLLTLFNKAQNLSKKQKETVKDFLSAFVLKADLTQKLAQ